MTRCLLVMGLGLAGWQAWSSLTTGLAPPERSVIPAETIAAVQITLGQAALALRDFGKAGLLSDRFEFESGTSRVRRSLETLAGLAAEPEERKELERARALLDRLGQIKSEHVARTDAGGGLMPAETLAEIARLRDEAARALTEFQAVGVRRKVATEPDAVGRLLQSSAGIAAALISLCIGAITLWSRLFPA